MKRSDLVNILKNEAGLSAVNANIMVKQIFDAMIELLLEQGVIQLRRFGTLELRKHASYTTFNPSTKKNMFVEEKQCVHFKVARSLKEHINARNGKNESMPKSKKERKKDKTQ